MAFVDWVSFKWKGNVFATGRNRKICNWRQDQNFDSGKGLPWGTRTGSCGISSGWHYCSQALWCRLLFWNTGMGYAAVASGNWSVQSSLQKAMLSWLHAQCLSNDAISIRFSFLECGHSNELPQPHSSLKNTWIASTSLCTPPTIAAVVRLMRHFYSALFPLAPPKEEGIDLLFCGAHTTQAGFPFVVSLSSVKLAAALLLAFTSHRPIRTANDLARPFLCSSSFSRWAVGGSVEIRFMVSQSPLRCGLWPKTDRACWEGRGVAILQNW